MRNTIAATLRTLLFFLAAGMFLSSCEKTEEAERSSEASMTSLTLTVEDTDYAITFTGKEGKITLPSGTELPATATVKAVALSAKAKGVKVGDKIVIPVSGTVTLTVTAEDGETTQDYTVTLSLAANEGASITALTLTVGDTDYEIMFEGTRGSMTLPSGTAIPTAVEVKEITLSDGATSDAGNGTELTVTDNTVTLTVTAEDGETESAYTVTFSVAASREASITSLTLMVEDTDYEIMFEDRQDTLMLPSGTALPTKVGVKEITLSDGATSEAGNGAALTVTDNAVTLTVTAEDGETKQDYTVTLVVSQVAAPLFTSFTFEVTDNENMALDAADRQRIEGEIDQQAKTITFPKQSAYVYLNRLKASFTASAGATVQVGGVTRTSGVTEQDFSSPVSYVVRAQDGTETTYTVTLIKSTMATIPDVQFRAKLKELFPAAFTADQLNIMHDEMINNKGNLNINSQNPRITSLKGIEFFTALDSLNGGNNALTSLDLSKNTALTRLYCNDNNLTSLDVSANTALTTLACGSNALTSLDLSKNTALMLLKSRGNRLTSLDFSKNTALMDLDCSHNRLTSLDVSANTALMTLACGSNALDSLDVHANTALTFLWCYQNSLTFLDMTGMRSLVYAEALNIGTGTGENNPLATLRVNTVLQDRAEVITMKTARGADLTVTTVNNEGTEVCTDYTPAQGGGTCNDN